MLQCLLMGVELGKGDVHSRAVGAHQVKAAHGGSELIALFAFQQELCNLFAPALILHGSGELLFLILVLILVVNRLEAVVGIHNLVIRFGMLGLDFPYTFLF